MSYKKLLNTQLVQLPITVSQYVISNYQKIKQIEDLIETLKERVSIQRANKDFDPDNKRYRHSIIQLDNRIKRNLIILDTNIKRRDKLYEMLDQFEENHLVTYGPSYVKIPPQELYDVIISIHTNSIHYYNHLIQSQLDFYFDEKKVLQKHQIKARSSNLPLYYELNKRLFIIQQSINKYINIQTFVINYKKIPNKTQLESMTNNYTAVR